MAALADHKGLTQVRGKCFADIGEGAGHVLACPGDAGILGFDGLEQVNSNVQSLVSWMRQLLLVSAQHALLWMNHKRYWIVCQAWLSRSSAVHMRPAC